MLGTSNNNGNSKTFNTSWQLTRASVDGLAQAIESGQQDALASYLGVMARFPHYSARNVLLIAAQRPDAKHLEGVRSWNELGRFVRPGEKGIYIFAPAVSVQKRTQPQESSNGKKAKSKKAKSKKAKSKKAKSKKAKSKKAPDSTSSEAHPETQLLGFRGVWVFDIAQTGGEQLPEVRQPLDTREALQQLSALAQSRGMTIEYADGLGSKKATSYRGTIRMVRGMEPDEAFPLLLHEVASQLLYAIQRRTFVTKALHQQETKAVAFVVSEALALDKSAFSDCQLYYGDSRLLGESLEVVHRTAAVILGVLRPEVPASFAQEVRQ